MNSKEALEKKFDRIAELNEELDAIKSEIERLAKRQYKLNEERNDIIKSTIIRTFPNTAETFSLSPNMTIGNAVENIIRVIKVVSQKDLIEMLNNAQIPISKKNPYVVIANLIKRDAKKRFKKTKDGKIFLRNDNEKADAKS